jgi:acyl carrier protein
MMTHNPKRPCEAEIVAALRRCSSQTQAAGVAFFKTGDLRLVPDIVAGIIERYVERDLRPRMRVQPEKLRLAQDLSVDSLTMMEIVMLAEEVLQIAIDPEDLRQIQTVGDVQQFVLRKLQEQER